VRQNKFNDFLHFYQTIDVLIVDDVQELTTAKTQQTFFHIFNHLQQNRKQLVMTCDRPPVLFEGIEERMLTRFKWGMIAELEKPDTALRKAILESKIRRDGLSIPKDVIKYIASNVESSVRELEGIVNSIMAYSIVDNCNINIALAERIVARAVNLEKREVTADDIIQAVAQRFGLKQKDLLSKSRKQNLVQARQLAMYLVHKYTGISYVQIGRRFGGRDHTTVLHACNQVSLRISMEKDFRHEVETLELALKK
jgi:chromosomal replication initiator protein